MMEFLAHVRVRFPESMTEAQVEDLRHRERELGKRLWREGRIKRIWRVPGKKSVIGLYRAESVTALQEMFDSFPMYPYMDIDVYPLAAHALEDEAR